MKEKARKELSIILLVFSLWLIAAPFTFGYKDQLVLLNDLVCGILLFVGGLFSFRKWSLVSFFLYFFLGSWLHFSATLFWDPEPVYYVNDSLLGILISIVAFLFLRLEQKEELLLRGQIPKGWSFNPSSWSHRVPVLFLALICWFLARYLEAYQLGYISHVWDPFFGEGTEKVLTSKVSQSFPIPDAGLGAFAYSLEALFCWQGTTSRFKTMPWVVFSFGVLALPVGITSIILIILQPLVVGAWCSICLFIAFCMLLIVSLTVGEVIAAFQQLTLHRASGGSLWKYLWEGESIGEGTHLPTGEKLFQGITPTWSLFLQCVIGVCVCFFPSTINTHPIAADFILGPLVIVFSLLSMTEPIRTLRFVNSILGGWLFFAAIHTGCSLCFFAHALSGAFLILLPFFKGKIKEKYGTWDKYIF